MVRESYKERCGKFCGICGNYLRESQECNEVNEKSRREYVEADSCSYAVIKGVHVSILKGNKFLVELGGEWCDRDDLEK